MDRFLNKSDSGCVSHISLYEYIMAGGECLLTEGVWLPHVQGAWYISGDRSHIGLCGTLCSRKGVYGKKGCCRQTVFL